MAQIFVTDDANRVVILEKPANRIVTLSPNANDILENLHLRKLIVGTIYDNTNDCQLKYVEKVGQYTNPDLERIVFLKPDLVILPRYGVPFGLYQQLLNHKIPVFVLNPTTFIGIANDINFIGILTGHQQQAKKVATEFLKKLDQIKINHSPKVSVFYELWDKPLMTVGHNTFINQIISFAGGNNIFDYLSQSYVSISLATVIAANPQVIFVSDERQIAEWNQWPMLQAVKYHHIYVVSPDDLQRNSPRILKGVIRLKNYLSCYE